MVRTNRKIRCVQERQYWGKVNSQAFRAAFSPESAQPGRALTRTHASLKHEDSAGGNKVWNFEAHLELVIEELRRYSLDIIQEHTMFHPCLHIAIIMHFPFPISTIPALQSYFAAQNMTPRDSVLAIDYAIVMAIPRPESYSGFAASIECLANLAAPDSSFVFLRWVYLLAALSKSATILSLGEMGSGV